MKHKNLAIIAILLVFCATLLGVFFGGGETADAAVTTGTSLFTSSVGSTTVTSTPQAQGILITYKTSAEESAVLYRHNLDMNYFGIKIKVNSKHFESFYVELTDTEDSGNVVVADFSAGETEGTMKVLLSDALDTEIQSTNSVETVIGTTDKPIGSDDVIELVYAADTENFTGQFKVKVYHNDGTESEYVLAVEEGDEKVEFVWLHGAADQVIAPLMEAKMRVGVTGQETQDNVDDDVTPVNSSLHIQSISNILGEQGLTSNETSVEENVVPPLIKFSNLEYRGKVLNVMEAEELEKLFEKDADNFYIYDTIGAKAKGDSNASYKFPFYAVSVLGKGFDKITWSVKEGEAYFTEPEVISSQTSKSLDADVDSLYKFYFRVIMDYGDKVDDEYIEENYTKFEFYLNVRVVDDKQNPVINNDGLKAFVYSKITDMTINAPATGSYEFPVVNTSLNISEGNLFTDMITEEEENSFDNLSVVIGYKRPNSTSDWTFSSTTKVTFNSVGTWAFVYKVTDQSGNEALSDVFLFDVQDVTPPTIKASDKNVTVNEILTVPTPTRSDNCVGVDTSKSDYRIWEWNEDTQTKGAEITKTVKEQKFTPKTVGDKYIVEYEAEDKVGNRSEVVSAILTVVEATAVTPEPNPANDVLIIILIVVGTLVIVTLAIYLFMGKKEDKRPDAREALISDDSDEQNKQ